MVSCITIFPPLSAGFIAMLLLLARDLMAFLSDFERLNLLYAGAIFSSFNSSHSKIKHTGHFLNIIKDIHIEEKDLLVAVDVSSLYTNIKHEEGIEALKSWLIKNGTDQEKSEFIGTLAKLVLTSNYFTFNGKMYLQKQGTAMGTRMAPNYAIIFMHSVKQEILKNSKLKPMIWRRFIDDVFIIWTHGKDKLEEFLDYINKAHETIKFTAEYSMT